MNWAWISSLDQIWRSATFPMWLTLAAAGFFGLILLITLLRAERSVANGALTVITLLAIGVAVAATIRGFEPGGESAIAEARPAAQPVATPAALACVDDLAGDAVLSACEKVLFGSADTAAAAVSYAAGQITRLTAFGDLATAERNSTTELRALRRAVERDHYGLMAYVLTARDHCTPTSCAAFRSLGTSQQIASNMDEHVYENLVSRYAPGWNAPPPALVAAGVAPGLAGLPASVPTGKPTSAEFPSAANTPAVNIMTAEPTSKPLPATVPTATAPPAAPPRAAPAVPPAARKQAAQKRPAPAAAAPVPIAPPPSSPASTAAPTASQD